MAFTDCPTGFDIPQPFFDFQLETELGNSFTDDFPDNRENRGQSKFSFINSHFKRYKITFTA